jgi:hypothetical protein
MIVCRVKAQRMSLKTTLLLGALLGSSAVLAQKTSDQELAPADAQPEAPSRPQSLLPGQIDGPQSTDVAPTGAPTIVPENPTSDDAIASGTSAAPAPSATAALPLPSTQRKPEDALGVLDPTTGGFDRTLWQGSLGSFITELMNRMQVPIGSRIGHITLRRALASKAVAPRGSDPVSFDAARTQLLLRLGEADLASRLAAQVPQASYNRRLYAVAAQAHLAAFNLPATCPLAAKAIVFSQDSIWPLLSAICAALQGDEGGAALGLELARDSAKVNRFDLAIADRMVTAVTGGGRGGIVDWPEKGILTTYRLATIYLGGQVMPSFAITKSNAAVQGWMAQSGAVDSQARMLAGWTAASTGVMNTDAWIGLWASRGAAMSPAVLAYAPEGNLMRANTGLIANRLKAIKGLWALGKSDRGRMAMYLLSSDAAARLPVLPQFEADAGNLTRAMMLGGKTEAALRWYDVLGRAKSATAQSERLEMWAALEILDSKNRVAGSADQLKNWIAAQPEAIREKRGRLALAALRGLGVAYAQDASVGVKVDDTPSGKVFELLAAAAARRAKGEVVVLAALVMGDQPESVNGESLEQVVKAYRRVGLEREARLMAAEAVLMAKP